MTKIVNRHGDIVDDYETAYKFAKEWKAPKDDEVEDEEI